MGNKKIESKYLTVSEIAKNTGVTRNKVWSYIRKNNIKPVKKTDKIFYFDFKIVSEIEKKYKNKQIKNSNSNNNNAVSSSILEILEKQLEANQEIIKKQQKTIEKQQETIDYFKNENIALRLDNSKKQKLLEDGKKKQEAISENREETANKQSWWSKIFHS